MQQFPEIDRERIRSAARDVIARYHLPGISIGVVAGNDLAVVEGFGSGDIESNVPMDPARHQRIASITKTMAGLCTLALVDEGKLSLDDRAATHLPDVRFNGPGDQITLRHLLTHTSGIGEAPTADALATTIDPNHIGGDGDFSTLYPSGIDVEAEPGTKWAYANHGYALLGEIIARTEQQPLGEVMRRRVFEPLGMTETTCARDPEPRLTTPYHRAVPADTRELLERAGIVRPVETDVDGHNIRGAAVPNDHHGMLAAGAVQSTVFDMARYASALLQRGAGIVRPATFDAMIAPQWCADERLTSWGLSFIRWNRHGERSFGHGGSYFGGWNSHLGVFPDRNLAVIVHMNVMLDTSAPVFVAIERAVLGIDAPIAHEVSPHERTTRDAPGVYECRPGKLTNFRPSTNYGRVQVSAQDGGLSIRSRRGVWKDGVPLVPTDTHDALIYAACAPGADPAPVLFTADASGRIDGMHFGEMIHMLRNDALAPWA